ncbi:uncharacterized protein BJ212DRAFT_1333278 [Suillus subaureus]|uniref:Uncharacterized protein n=1 Tax=Suillus subaureus TaxID=48587 RepID=A0A9P7EI75_9AGAM|nr:uncharacterized protein BJ212DRAFT_1333278 [Suillus subaureus]KAG1821752.1 hypothetical protein BJ212DRAFT_1333278 [Suillus subaureus]
MSYRHHILTPSPYPGIWVWISWCSSLLWLPRSSRQFMEAILPRRLDNGMRRSSFSLFPSSHPPNTTYPSSTSRSHRPLSILDLQATSTFHQEGCRSLQMVISIRHLQRVLDAFPSVRQVPKTDNSTIHVISDRVQKSNVIAVSVCPGLSRSDTIALLLTQF